MSGGSVHPVNHGDMARAIHPEGEIKKATPIAMAACGVDNNGATNPPMRRDHERSCATPQNAMASASEIIVGESENMTPGDQAHQMGSAWERTPHDRALVTQFVIHHVDGHVDRFSLGAHAPSLTLEDIEHIHRVWVEAVKIVGPEIHHRDVVVAALGSLEDELSARRDAAVARLKGRPPSSGVS